MELLDAVQRKNLGAVKKALAAGEKPDFECLAAGIEGSVEVLKALIGAAKPSSFKGSDPEDSLLMTVGMHIRSAYPNGIRNKRSSDPSVKEPAVIVGLREKARLLREAGAPVSFGAAAMLNYTEVVAAMLAKDPKLATKKVWDQGVSDLAAWAGAWEASRLIKEARSGKPFDWDKLATALAAWATKALNGFAKQQKGKTFRRVALDVDSGEAGVLLAADIADGKATRPGDYSHGELASFERHAMHGALAAQLERGDPAKIERFLAAAARAAELLAADRALALPKAKGFAVIAFDHDEDEADVTKRLGKRAKPAKARPAKTTRRNSARTASKSAKPARRARA